MGDPRRVFCRDCGKAAYGPDSMYFDELQKWYEIRHGLAEVRMNWPGYADAPSIPGDYDNDLTDFFCDHKDHDLCMTEAYSHDKVVEFDKSKDKKDSSVVRRHFRELVGRFELTGNIKETDRCPRLHWSLVAPENRKPWDCEMTAPPLPSPVRFIFKKEELVLLRTYEEEQ